MHRPEGSGFWLFPGFPNVFSGDRVVQVKQISYKLQTIA